MSSTDTNETMSPDFQEPEAMITKYCKYCGKPFTVKVSTKGGRPKLYCSRRCRDKYNIEQRNAQKDDNDGDEDVTRKSASKDAQSPDSSMGPEAANENGPDGSCQTSSPVPNPGATTERSDQSDHQRSLGPNKVITATDLEAYKDNPFVSKATLKKVTLGDNFYLAAKPFESLGIDKIFSIFELNSINFDEDEKDDISYKVMNCPEVIRAPELVPFPCTDTALRIMFNRMAIMDLELERVCKDIGQRLHEMTTLERKKLCLTIRDFPKDPAGRYTVSFFLKLMNISRNSYYCYIGNERYGLDIRSRDDLDEPIVRKAFEYKGFKKGVRQVYMLIPRISNKKIGIDRVRRIMKENGMVSGIRAANPQKRSRAKFMKSQVKPNLLKRMFKLHRPNKVRVTDVTYLDIQNNIRVYGSALIDPVTNLLVTFNLSEHNDMDLVMETLRQSDTHPCVNGGIMHSDQGILYLSSIFQEELKKMGVDQSMSKRGNCQDNAVAESFFSVFKTEVEYSNCASIEELRILIEGFKYYYNYERGHWDYQGMTPVEYETYLLAMDDAEFEEYLIRERKKYDEKKNDAAEKAKERAKTLGV